MLNDVRKEPGVTDETALLLLSRIGATLGVPTSAFFDGPGGERLAGLAGAGELLRLWGALRSERDRAAVLTYLRTRVLAQPT